MLYKCFVFAGQPTFSHVMSPLVPRSLTNHFRDLHTLRSLLAGLTLPVQNISEMTNSDDREATTEDKESSLVPPRPASPWSMNQLTPMQQRLGKLASTEGKRKHSNH